MKKQRTTALFLACVLLIAFAAPIKASAIDIAPCYTNISTIACYIGYSGDLATCDVSVIAFSGTTNITATMSLQKQNSDGTYTTIKTWPTESINDRSLSITKNWYVDRGSSYRTYLELSVTRNGTTEKVTSNSNTVKCN